MDYVVNEKPVIGVVGKWKWLRFSTNKKKSVDLRTHMGYVKIGSLNNGHKIYVNQGNIITDIDI